MKAVLIAAAAGLCWGVGELFTKMVLHTGKIGPLTAIAVRSTVALPILWALYVLWVPLGGPSRRTGPPQARRRWPS